MDQATFEGLLKSFASRCTAEQPLRDLTTVPGKYDSPIVVLVHGIGGNAQHWTNPATLDASQTWLFNLGAEPQPGGGGILSSPPYAPNTVTNWGQVLQGNLITFVNWSISRPDDLLTSAVDELSALLRILEQTVFAPYDADAKASGGQVPPLVILAHSRGGLVTRAALKQLGNAGVPHLRKVITLATPHHGSYMPRLANDYNQRLTTALDFSPLAQRLPVFVRPFFEQAIDRYVDTLANSVRTAFLHSFGTLAQGPGFEELQPGSTMLTTLKQAEQPLPNVHYFGFGGSNPVFVNFYLSGLGQVFYLMSAIGTFIVERLGQLPGIATSYGGLQELITGDSAVGLASSRWPEVFGAQHQELKFNHMQALIDSSLQSAVIGAIRA